MSWADTLSVDDFLSLKARGFFRIETVDGRPVVTIHQLGEPVQRIACASPGHANQVRQALSDMGLTGYVEGAR